MSTRSGDWGRMHATLGQYSRGLRNAMQKALQQEGQRLRRDVVQGITRQAPGDEPFKRLAPLTVATRRLRRVFGTKALLDRADLRNSIGMESRGDNVFVGVLRAARRRRGGSLVDLARTHEFGHGPVVISITPRMRRFLAALYKAAGVSRTSMGRARGVIVMTIPPRPFLRPAFRSFSRGAAERFRRALGALGMGASRE